MNDQAWWAIECDGVIEGVIKRGTLELPPTESDFTTPAFGPGWIISWSRSCRIFRVGMLELR